VHLHDDPDCLWHNNQCKNSEIQSLLSLFHKMNKSNFLYFIFKKVQAGGCNEHQCQLHGRRRTQLMKIKSLSQQTGEHVSLELKQK
jgi:hypothetical protein